jgi:hypothetical protein
MGQIYTKYFPPPPTDQEKADIKQDRLKFYNELKLFQDQIKQDQTAKDISPDTANELTKIVSNSQEWLRSNPDASTLQVTAKRDDLAQLKEPIMEREVFKNKYIMTLWYAKYFEKLYYTMEDAKKIIKELKVTDSEIDSIKALIDDGFKLIKSKPSETGLTYSQYIDDFFDKLEKILVNHPNFKKELEAARTQRKEAAFPIWWELKNEITKVSIAAQQKSNSEFNGNRALKNSAGIAIAVFGSLIIFAIIIFGGSVAANMAINRDWYYRLFYFIFGCNPLLTPIIIAYAGLCALKGNSIIFYAMCPIIKDPPKTRLSKILTWPFYYVTDSHEEVLKQAFIDSVRDVGNAVKAA